MPLPRRPLAAALFVFSACAWGQGTATVYGRLNVAAEQVRGSGTPTDRRLSNNRSVLGFRGEEDLGEGLKAVWQLEGAISLDTGAGQPFSRDTRIGLSHPRWGTLFAGLWTLPYTSATAAFDPFYPTTAGYMALMGNGSASSSDHTGNTSAFDRRQQNVLQYWAPTVGGLSARFAYAPNEGEASGDGGRPSLFSASASYATGPWLWVLAHEAHRDYQRAGGTDTGWKLGASYAAAPLRLSLAAERLRYDTPAGPLKRDSAFAAATWRQGALTWQAAIGKAWRGRGATTARVGALQGGAHTGALQTTLGADYALSPRTSVFAFWSRIDNQRAAPYDFAINESGVRAGGNPSVTALGLRHTF